jgi:hypothetical protein
VYHIPKKVIFFEEGQGSGMDFFGILRHLPFGTPRRTRTDNHEILSLIALPGWHTGAHDGTCGWNRTTDLDVMSIPL